MKLVNVITVNIHLVTQNAAALHWNSRLREEVWNEKQRSRHTWRRLVLSHLQRSHMTWRRLLLPHLQRSRTTWRRLLCNFHQRRRCHVARLLCKCGQRSRHTWYDFKQEVVILPYDFFAAVKFATMWYDFFIPSCHHAIRLTQIHNKIFFCTFLVI